MRTRAGLFYSAFALLLLPLPASTLRSQAGHATMTDSAPTTLEEWKALAEDSARRLQDKETELDEFAQSSQELEEDLERELDQLRGEKATLEQAVVKVGEQLKARNVRAPWHLCVLWVFPF